MEPVKEKPKDIFKIGRRKKGHKRGPKKKRGPKPKPKIEETIVEKKPRKKYKRRKKRVLQNDIFAVGTYPEQKRGPKKKKKPKKPVIKPEPVKPIKTIKKKTRKKKTYHKKRGNYKTKYTCIEKAVKILFENDNKDLKYVSENKALLMRHLEFLKRRPISNGYINQGFILLDVELEGKIVHPISFVGFDEVYPYIYNRWAHLIKSCYDKDYIYYPFIGGKGLTMSKEFIDGRAFCAWCLRYGLTSKLGMYKDYLIRKNKKLGYSPDNCYVVTEKDIHNGKTIDLVLDSLCLAKKYEEGHSKGVTFPTAYTRYYIWDFCVEDALNHTSHKNTNRDIYRFGFSPYNFYCSVADESSCTWPVFRSRVHWHYLDGGLPMRPYDMLKPDFSISAAANMQGRLSYKQQYDRAKKDERDKCSPYIQNEKLEPISKTNMIDEFFNVYNFNNESDVYSK